MRLRFSGLIVATLAILASANLNSGCGTVMGRSGLQDLEVHLNPDDPEATLRVNGIPIQKGERRVQVDPKRESNTVEVTTPDGKIGKGAVTRELVPGIVIADAFMLLFPIYIDYANGGMYKIQKDLVINLGKPAEPSRDPEPVAVDPGKNKPVNASNDKTKPCSTCGEPRPVNSETCPHCGIK